MILLGVIWTLSSAPPSFSSHHLGVLDVTASLGVILDFEERFMSTSSTSSSPHWRSWRPYWRRHLLLFVASTSSSSSSFSPSFGHFRGLCALARPFAHTAHLFACSALLAVLCCAHFAQSQARGTVNDWMAIMSVFFYIFDHSACGIAASAGWNSEITSCSQLNRANFR